MKVYAPLFILWVAITLPVVAVGFFIYRDNHIVRPVTVQTIVVTPTVVPTATPSATLAPVYKAVVPTAIKGVK